MNGCAICGVEENLINHHLNYDKNLTIKVCRSCHMAIHRTDKHNNLKPTDKIGSTAIAISEKTKKELDKLKIHPREPYKDVVKRLINERKVKK